MVPVVADPSVGHWGADDNVHPLKHTESPNYHGHDSPPPMYTANFAAMNLTWNSAVVGGCFFFFSLQ